MGFPAPLAWAYFLGLLEFVRRRDAGARPLHPADRGHADGRVGDHHASPCCSRTASAATPRARGYEFSLVMMVDLSRHLHARQRPLLDRPDDRPRILISQDAAPAAARCRARSPRCRRRRDRRSRAPRCARARCGRENPCRTGSAHAATRRMSAPSGTPVRGLRDVVMESAHHRLGTVDDRRLQRRPHARQQHEALDHRGERAAAHARR